ncbi:unnamed protein product, partial [Cylicocyclus nassatus]
MSEERSHSGSRSEEKSGSKSKSESPPSKEMRKGHRTRSDELSGDSDDDNGRRGFVRMAKHLKSPSLYKKGALALAEKVKGRRPLNAKSKESLTADEIIFPLAYASDEERAEKKKKMSFEDHFAPESGEVAHDTYARAAEKMREGVVPRLSYSRMPLIKTNKTNNNNLFVNNMPFWWNPEPNDITDDELVMNAGVIIEVLEHRLKLVPMPDIEIILDPVEHLKVLKRRDALCFTKEIIFGNTVRSMVNLNELSLRELHERSLRQFRKKNFPDHPSKEEPEVLNIVEPKHRVVYH